MPIYDVKCSQCSFEGTATVPISELSQWDREALCPNCQEGSSSYRRIIKMAPSSIGTARPNPKAKLTSGDKDDMKHEVLKRRNPDQVAAAVESVRKGEFEGF